MSLSLEEYNKWAYKLRPMRNSLGDKEYYKIVNALSCNDIDRVIEVLCSVCGDKDELNKSLKMAWRETFDLMNILDGTDKDTHNVIRRMKNDMKKIIAEKDAEIVKLKEQIESVINTKDCEIRDLEDLLEESRQREQELYLKRIGMTWKDGKNMREDYERGKSLRELAKIYSCDKATVKRRLIKMGVTIQNKVNKE